MGANINDGADFDDDLILMQGGEQGRTVQGVGDAFRHALECVFNKLCNKNSSCLS